MLLPDSWRFYLAQRYVSGKSKPGWAERWGHLPSALHASLELAPRVSGFMPFLQGKWWPPCRFCANCVSCCPSMTCCFPSITPAGHEMAEQQARPYIDGLFYFPFDVPWVARRRGATIRPAGVCQPGKRNVAEPAARIEAARLPHGDGERTHFRAELPAFAQMGAQSIPLDAVQHGSPADAVGCGRAAYPGIGRPDRTERVSWLSAIRNSIRKSPA